MVSRAVLAALDVRGILTGAGVVVMGLFIWLILVILLSFFVRRAGPARLVLNQVRFVLLPALIFYVLARLYPLASVEGAEVVQKVAKTALAAATVLCGLGLLKVALAPSRLRRMFHREVPQLLVDVVRYLVLILAVAVILKNIWGENVGPLIGALGIGGVVLGLALQETLSNFFSGLAILAERPFDIGDWIRVGEGVEGRVEHVTWRAVKICTSDNEYVIYPNSMVAKEKVVNYNLPTPVLARRVMVGTSYRDPPELVKRTIREVLEEVPGILSDPPPSITTTAYADFSINYEIKFFLREFQRKGLIADDVMTRLWYAFRRRGIEIPFPVREVYHHGLGVPAVPGAGAAPPANGEKEAVARALQGVAIFAELPPPDLEELGRSAKVAVFAQGERVVRQGEPGEALYAIARGEARVVVRGPEGEEREVAVLKAGDVFGEMSLLTGEPRTATVYSQGDLEVVEVGKAALAPVLTRSPGLASRMAEAVVARRQGLDRVRTQALEEPRRREIETAARTLLRRMRVFFGLQG